MKRSLTESDEGNPNQGCDHDFTEIMSPVSPDGAQTHVKSLANH